MSVFFISGMDVSPELPSLSIMGTGTPLFMHRAKRRASSLSLPEATIVGRFELCAPLMVEEEVVELVVVDREEVVVEDLGQATEIGQEVGWEEPPELL